VAFLTRAVGLIGFNIQHPNYESHCVADFGGERVFWNALFAECPRGFADQQVFADVQRGGGDFVFGIGCGVILSLDFSGTARARVAH
jgi:hypothetical protein